MVGARVPMGLALDTVGGLIEAVNLLCERSLEEFGGS
jgi:hypothetical protein